MGQVLLKGLENPLTDLLPALKGEGSPRPRGLHPFTGATRLWSTGKEGGFLTTYEQESPSGRR